MEDYRSKQLPVFQVHLMLRCLVESCAIPLHLGRFTFTANVTGFRIIMGTQLWVCLWGCFQKWSAGEGRPTVNVGGTILWVEPNEKVTVSWVPEFSSLCFWHDQLPPSPTAVSSIPYAQNMSSTKPSFLKLLYHHQYHHYHNERGGGEREMCMWMQNVVHRGGQRSRFSPSSLYWGRASLIVSAVLRTPNYLTHKLPGDSPVSTSCLAMEVLGFFT